MLSRVASRIYWLARYLERVENTARLIFAYNKVVLDLPQRNEMGWDILLRITASEQTFADSGGSKDEAGIVSFLCANQAYPGAIVNAVTYARENIRTTREAIPTETWEKVNELHLYVQKEAEHAARRKYRHQFLREVIARCQQIAGLVEGTMSHDQAYAFLQIGRELERADMTSRILDVGAGILLVPMRTPLPFDALLWMSILESLSALDAYRLRVGPRVTGSGVTKFLLQDPRFPRSFLHCLERIEESLVELPRSQVPLSTLGTLKTQVGAADTAAMAEQGTHRFVDQIQCGLIELDRAIAQTWLESAPATSISTSSQSQTSF